MVKVLGIAWVFDCFGSVVLSLELFGSLFVEGLTCHVCFSVSGCLGEQ